MTTSRFAPKMGVLAVLLAGTVGLISSSTSASDWGFSLGFGGRPAYTQAAVVTTPVETVTTDRRWVPEHYETRTEQVLVAPAGTERRYVNPVYSTRFDRRVLVTAGYWTEVCVPAQYETRTTQVLVPGYYEDAPVVYNDNVVVGGYGPAFVGGFSWGHDRDGHHDEHVRFDQNRRDFHHEEIRSVDTRRDVRR